MSPTESRIYEFGEFRLDADEHTLHRGQELVDITPRTFALLLKLVENPGRLLQKETLMQEVWADSVVEEGNLNRTMSNLRKVLGEKPKEDRYIQTVPRVGYRFIAPVTIVSAAISTDPPAQITPAADATSLAPAARLNRTSRWIFPALVVVLVVVLFGGLITWQRRASIAAPKAVPPLVKEPVRLTNNPGDDSHPRWTKDGRIRFFNADTNNQTRSFIMNADGTGQSAVNDFANLKTGVWSPDGRKVVFQKPDDNHASYLANADGSNEIALPFIRGNFDWSFDSKQIVYQKTVEENNSEIFIYSLATKQSRNLSKHPLFDADPSFSPDNKQVVFVSNRNGNNDLYLINVDGSGGDPIRLTYSPADDSHPVFSPDGTAVAFTSDRKNESADAYLLLTLSGSEVVVPLTDWLSNETVEPGCWSPDGTTIAFHSDRNGKDDIYTVNAEVLKAQLVLADPEKNLGFPAYSPDGRYIVHQAELDDKSTELSIYDTATNQTRVIRRSELGDAAPAWSPDGEWIVFQSRQETNTEICVIKPDGTGFKNLTNHPARDLSPTWSPDGKQIAFASNRGPSTQVFQLFVMNADGTDQRQIYSSPGSVTTPAWSPNGGIYFADDKEDNRTGNFEIFSLSDGSADPPKRLTFRKRFDVSPVPAPRTRSLVFVSELDGNSEIYWMYYTGSALVRLSRNAAADISPHWSPDGQRIIFSSNRGGKFALYEISLSAFSNY